MNQEDPRLRSLVRGDLPDEMRASLEDELFASDELWGELLAVEEGVLEGLLDGTVATDAAGGLDDATRARELARIATLRAAAAIAPALGVLAAAVAARRHLRLRPGLERGSAPPPALATDAAASVTPVAPGTDAACIVLELAAPGLASLPVRSAQVAVEDAGGRLLAPPADLWIAPGVPPIVVVVLDGALLPPGLLRLRLSAELPTGEVEEIDDYFLEIDRP